MYITTADNVTGTLLCSPETPGLAVGLSRAAADGTPSRSNRVISNPPYGGFFYFAFGAVLLFDFGLAFGLALAGFLAAAFFGTFTFFTALGFAALRAAPFFLFAGDFFT
jgi:hypothetical protein